MYTIYGTPNCGYCVKAKDTLTEQGIAYDYHDIMTDIEQRTIVQKRVPDMKTVPQIFEGDTYIGGYTELAAHLQSGSVTE